MKRSLHPFVADPNTPRWCSLCGRAEMAHQGTTECARCGSPVTAAGGCCVACGTVA